jgi:hypothetical protein
MSFEAAVKSCPRLASAYRRGLQGLKRVDRQRVRISDSRRLRGSVDLEEALAADLPNQPIWDYGLGLAHNRNGEMAVWLEVHPASSLHVGPVIWKLRCAVAFNRNSPQFRQVAQAGLLFRSGVLRLDEPVIQ